MTARAPKKTPAKVAATPPVMVEVRLAGRIKLAQQCYNPQLTMDTDAGTVTLTASLEPVMIDVAPQKPPTPFGHDPRDGTAFIQQVHSGGRT